MCQQYVERCQKLGVEPDAALLGPIDEVFERLQAESGEAAPAARTVSPLELVTRACQGGARKKGGSAVAP